MKLNKVVWIMASVYLEHDLGKIFILMLLREREQNNAQAAWKMHAL
jgi:hypothetical protein